MLLLASASPRRADILRSHGIEFSVESADIDETPLADEQAKDYVARLAREKALDRWSSLVASDYELILGADTCVALGNSILGKPRDYEDFISMMNLLSDAVHEVHSAVAVISRDRQVETALVSTRVEFREVSMEEILRYWQTGEPLDKAGGYGIQGLGEAFVRRIEGSYSNVVGLPIMETLALLKTKGVSAHLFDSGAK